MITTSFNVPSHLYLNTLQCVMCYFLITLSDLLNVDLMLPFFLPCRLAKPPLLFYPAFCNNVFACDLQGLAVKLFCHSPGCHL